MNVVGALAWTGQAVLVFLLLRASLGILGALLVAVCIGAGCAGSGNWIALEINWAAGLTLMGICWAYNSKWHRVALVMGLAVIVRPDALVAVCLLGICGIIEIKARIWKPILLFAVIVSPWLLFADFYFGSVIPQSAVVKHQQSSLSAYATHIVKHYPTAVFSAHSLAIKIGIWLLALAGGVLLIRRDRKLWVLLAWGVLHSAAYLTLRPTTLHLWHLYPAVVVFSIAILGSFQLLQKHTGMKILRSTCIVSTLILVLLFAFKTGLVSTTYHGAYWNGARHEAYRSAASFILSKAGPKDRIAALEVGTVGFLSDLPMHDYSGLITPNPDADPKDIRWFILVSHQFRDWKANGWQAPEQVPFRNKLPLVRINSGSFYLWIFHFPGGMPP